MIGVLSERPERQAYDVLRDYWQQQAPSADFDAAWRKWLHDGVIAGTAFQPKAVTLAETAVSAAPAEGGAGLEISFRPDPAVFDGRYANNGWLQELPKPVTKLTWDTAALVGPLDIVIHNASILGPTPLQLLLDTECEDFERVLARLRLPT